MFAGRCDVRAMAKETKRLNKRFSKEEGWYWPALMSGEGRVFFLVRMMGNTIDI